MFILRPQMKTLAAILLIFPFLLTLVRPALAEDNPYQPPTPGIKDRQGIVWDTPVYDPVSKSYFALWWSHDRKDIYHGYNYMHADAEARGLMFKGVHGRLAVVDSMEVHEFLMRTFHPLEPVLIGVRYSCARRRLIASNGEDVSSFRPPWDTPWDQGEKTCAGNPPPPTLYASIAYSAVDKGFRWYAKSFGKEFFAYFVEFPVGHE